ncbi:MAG: type II secretion system protein [Phycisphaerales bacterium]
MRGRRGTLRSRSPAPRTRPGASLIELLVSIAIILVIAAVVLWALVKLYRLVKALIDGGVSSI